MEFLNNKEVKQGYNRFLIWLMVLLIAGCLSVQSYRWLEEMEDRYFINIWASGEGTETAQYLTAVRLDTLYRHFQLLGGGQVLHEDQLCDLIYKRINTLDTTGGPGADPVMADLMRQTRQAAIIILNGKDSIALLMKKEAALRAQLRNCLEQNSALQTKRMKSNEANP